MSPDQFSIYSQVRYVQGILHNKWNEDPLAKDDPTKRLIYRYHIAGAPFEVIKDAAKLSRNWTTFRQGIEEICNLKKINLKLD